MAKSFDQPVLNSNNIIISDARIFLKTYDSNYQFTGDSQVSIDSPPTGFVDAGLISQAAINITKDDIKLEVGLPKTTVKTAERSRTVDITFNFHELGAETVALITGSDKFNVLEAGTATGTPTTTLTDVGDSRYAAQFHANDKIVQIDGPTGALGSDEATVASVSGSQVTHSAFGAAASAGDIIVRAGGVASFSSSTKTFTMDTSADAARFSVGDLVTVADLNGISSGSAAVKALRDSVYRFVVTAVSGADITVDKTYPNLTVTNNFVMSAYNSVELVDQLGSQIRRTLLMFFDYEDDLGNAFQYCLYFPKVKATGAFSPDFKGGENYADVPAGFSSESVSMLMADGTTKRVMMVPYVFAS